MYHNLTSLMPDSSIARHLCPRNTAKGGLGCSRDWSSSRLSRTGLGTLWSAWQNWKRLSNHGQRKPTIKEKYSVSPCTYHMIIYDSISKKDIWLEGRASFAKELLRYWRYMPIRTEITTNIYWENVFILLFVWLVAIGFWQNYLHILLHFRDFGAKMLFFAI